MNSPSFIAFPYYLLNCVDVANYTTTNALYNAEIKALKFLCIFFENAFFKPIKVKGDGFCVYQAAASHIMSCCLHYALTGSFPLGKKPGMKQATNEVVIDLKQFISQKDNALLQKMLAYMPCNVTMNLSKNR